MVMQLDTTIPLKVEPIKIESPLEAQTKALTLRNLAAQSQIYQAQLQDRQRQMDEQTQLAEIYRGATGPGGAVNHEAVIQGLAARGLGAKIPDYRKAMIAADKDTAETDTKKFELAKKRLDASGATISSLLQMPQVDHNNVIEAVSGLVSRGLMDQDSGAKLVRSMPGDPAQLRGWLTQKGLEVMDASKRMEMLTPNYQQVDQGGATIQGTVDPLTGKFTPNTAIAKTNTPGEVLSASTQRRGQDIQAETTRRGQDMTEGNAARVIQETPTGVVIVDKARGTVKPVRNIEGEQVQQPKSPAYEANQKRLKMNNYIAEARKLLPIATSSGIGRRVDEAAAQFGIAPPGADAAAQLDTIAGWMTSNVPRMEGPQSDKDVKVYQQMAAQVGNRDAPVSVRLKALETLEKLQKDYSHLNSLPNAPTPPKPGTPNPANPGKPRPPLSAFGG